MSRTRFWRIALVAIVVFALLAAVGSAIQRSIWTQGFMMGQLAGGGEDVPVVQPYMYPGYGYHGFSPFGSVLGTVLKIGLFVLLGFMILRCFGFHRWKRYYGRKPGDPEAGGPPEEHWAKHWKQWHRHGPMPPWLWDKEEKAAEEKAEQAEPEEETEADET